MGVSSEESLHNVATLHSLFMYAISCTFIYLSTSTILLKEKTSVGGALYQECAKAMGPAVEFQLFAKQANMKYI